MIRAERSQILWLATIASGIVLAAAGLFIVVQTSHTLEGSGETSLPQGTSETPTLAVVAGIPPLAYLAKRVGGEHVRVSVLVRPGQDPHLFEPTPRQVMNFSKARVFLQVGMPFEDRLAEKISEHESTMLVVDATKGIVKRTMTEGCCGHGHEAHEHDTHEHEAHEGEGGHADECGGADPHVWLAPKPLKVLVKNIAEALERADPAHAGDYRKNRADLDAELDALEGRIARALRPFHGYSFYVFHPAFGYFGDAYGLRQQSVEMEGKSPTPRQLRGLIHQARADGVKVIFLQPRFDPRTAEAVAEVIGGAVVPMDPLAEDVIANLDDVAGKIGRALNEAE